MLAINDELWHKQGSHHVVTIHNGASALTIANNYHAMHAWAEGHCIIRLEYYILAETNCGIISMR